METEIDLLNTQVAADFLQARIPEPGGAGYWSNFLINNRRSDRHPVHRIPFERIGTGAFYTPDVLEEFVNFERSRRIGEMKLTGRAAEALRAFGVGEPGSRTTGRKLEYRLNEAYSPETQEAFVQLVIENPLLVFSLSAFEARALAAEATEAADRLDGKRRQMTEVNKTITEDAVIIRREFKQ